jgi:phage/plasmid-like protein (TIGR03299 family)
MSANIATIDNTDAIAYLDSTPWHGLGENLLQRMRAATPDQYVDIALDAARMRYSVGSLPMYLADGTQIKGHMASVRYGQDGTVAATFGPVGVGHTHIQNEEAVAILRPMAEQFGCVPAAAGALGDGERCWMLMRLTDATITVVPGDDVRGYFLLTWGHNGQISVTGLGTGVRVICQNTLALAMHGRKAWFTVRHTASASQRLDEAAGIIAKVMKAMQVTGETFASMAARNLSAADVQAFITAVIPNTDPKADKVSKVIEARRETITQLVTVGKGAAMANQLVPGVSLWGAYNAITEYFDHVRPAEAQSEAGLLNAQTSALFGGNADIKAQALTVAQQLLAS